MADREKVIQRLEECLSASCRGFRTCPYSDDDWDAVREALALLKEQESVKPKKEGIAMNTMLEIKISPKFTLAIPNSSKDSLPILSCGDTSTEIPVETICQMIWRLEEWNLRADVREELDYQIDYNCKPAELRQYEEEIFEDCASRRQDDTSWHDDFMAALSTVAERHGLRV